MLQFISERPMVRRLCVLLWIPVVALAKSREEPGWEPPTGEYFGLGLGESRPVAAKRVANLSRAEFDRLARSGIPFVITDGARDSPLREWNCEYMQTLFGNVRFRREYGKSENNGELFGGDWTKHKVPIKGRKLPPGAPKYAPYYSDLVKARRDEPERQWGKKKEALAMEKAIVNATRTPYFMDKANLAEMKRNPEFWLQPPETGSLAHMDEHCISTIATTLSGVKRWRFASIPEKPHPKGYFDGLVYERDEWDPLFEFETLPGESVIFPPGMIHEGLSVGKDCVSSITYQFPSPAPVAYWRTFLPRVRRTVDMRNCVPFIAVLASLNDPDYNPRTFTKALQDAWSLGKSLDRDSDGSLSVKEMSARFKHGRRSSYSVDIVLDAWRYHDTNDDGITSIEEFARNFAAWSAIELQAREDGVTLHDPDDEQGLEL